MRRTPPKENGEHSKKEPTSPRSGRSSASSTPLPSKKLVTPEGSQGGENSSDKVSKPTTNGNSSATTSPQLAAPPSKPLGGIPGFPGVPGFPGPFPPPGRLGSENGYRPPFDSHPALRLPLGVGTGGKA